MPQAVRLLCPWDRHVDVRSAWPQVNSIQQQTPHILKTNPGASRVRVGGNERIHEVNMVSRGNIVINIEECKGCGLCMESCPPKCLVLAKELSPYGVHPAHYIGHDCTGCGICFYCCPEPGAITVYRLAAPPKPAASQGGEHAAAL